MRALTRLYLPLLTLISLLAFPTVGQAQQTLQQSATTRKIVFLMIDSSDHITGKTGLTVTATISKNGAAFASPAGTVAELSSGWYVLTPTTADTGTVGPLLLHATGTGADPVDKEFNVVAYNPDDVAALGLTTVTGINTKLGTPAGASVSADVLTANTALTSHTTSLSTLTTRIGTPAGASVSADIAAIPAAVWGVSVRTLSTLGASNITDGIWGAFLSSYRTSGTLGKKLGDVMTNGGAH